jgi:uncharacterized NAD(P)/FAD-binding protein YdhS
MLTTRRTAILDKGLPAAAPDPLAAMLPAGLPRYLRDAWSSEDLAGIGQDDRVLVLGTGLAAVGVVLTLDGQGHRAPIRLVSRHGLLPQRLAPPTIERLAALHAAGRLEICAGRVGGAAAYGDTFVIDILPRSRTLHLSERFDWIINCTAHTTRVRSNSRASRVPGLEPRTRENPMLALGAE